MFWVNVYNIFTHKKICLNSGVYRVSRIGKSGNMKNGDRGTTLKYQII